MVLVAFLFVLLAVVLNVTGRLMDDGLGFIYASIGCSTVAALVLMIAVRRSKRIEPPGPPDP
jgi:cytochrome b subunit of formate dehydrogenase